MRQRPPMLLPCWPGRALVVQYPLLAADRYEQMAWTGSETAGSAATTTPITAARTGVDWDARR